MILKASNLMIIDKPGEFSLKIGDTEIPFVTGYTVTSDVEKTGFIDLIIKISVPIDKGYGVGIGPSI